MLLLRALALQDDLLNVITTELVESQKIDFASEAIGISLLPGFCSLPQSISVPKSFL